MSIPLPIFVDKSRNYYSILNCHRSSNEEQILTEYKILAKKYHPDTASGCKEKFQEIEESKRILLCPSLRKSYDSWLDSGISVSFETWKEKCATNMHWANAETNSFRLLSRSQGESSSKPPNVEWERHSDETIRLFRDGKL